MVARTISLVSLWIVRATHCAVLAFVILGSFSSNLTILCVHAVFVPLMIASWKLNNGTCFLTDLEYQLLGIPKNQKKEQDGFIKTLINRLFAHSPEEKFLEFSIYLTTLSLWTISVVKLSFLT